jgi:hypothetical protein
MTNLNAIERAWKMLSGRQRTWLTKATLDLAPTGKNMHRWGFWPHGKCPCCLQPDENISHLLKCLAMSSRKCRATAIEKFGEKLERMNTQPLLRITLQLHLRYWTDLDHTPPSMTEDPDIQQAIISQGQIGWTDMLVGKTSKRWMAIQHQHLSETESFHTADRWATLLVYELWQVTWKIWTHRNEILHDSKTSHQIDQSELDNQLREQWNLGSTDLQPSDRTLFSGLTIEGLLSKNQAFQLSWLAQVTLARQLPTNQVDT